MKHIYSLATNRALVSDFFDSYINEIQFMKEKLNSDIIFAVVDESDTNTQKYNKKLLKMCKAHGIRTVHFDYENQKRFFDFMHSKNSTLVPLLDYPGFSYGRAMNKQFLLAGILQADCIHRRDSDVKIELSKFGYPSDMEIKFLGKKVSEIKKDKHINEINHSDNQTVHIVGSGYSGCSDWKADFRVFNGKEKWLKKELVDLFGYDKLLSEEYLNEIEFGDINVNKQYCFLPKKNHPNPICGNISFHKIFRYLPCCTILDTIGSDNLIREFLKEHNFPIIYHSNFVYHKFDNSRDVNDTKYLLSYFPRLINKLIYYKSIKEIIFKHTKTKYTDVENLDNINFPSIMNMELVNEEFVAELCNDCINDFKNVLEKSTNDVVHTICEMLSTKVYGQTTFENIYQGLLNGKILLEKWSEIMEISSDYGALGNY